MMQVYQIIVSYSWEVAATDLREIFEKKNKHD